MFFKLPSLKLSPETVTFYAPSDDFNLFNDISSIVKDDDSLHNALHQLSDYLIALNPCIKLILGINFVVFLLWQVNHKLMERHAAISNQNWKEKRWWSLFLGNFSHCNLYHIVGNMSVLLTIGPKLHEILGSKVFAGVIVASSLISGAATLLYNHTVAKLRPKSAMHQKMLVIPHLGFSGVCCTLLHLYAVMLPSTKVTYLYSDSNAMSIREIDNLAKEFDCIGLACQTFLFGTGISHIGHLGGALAGWLIRIVLLSTDKKKKIINNRARRLLSNK